MPLTRRVLTFLLVLALALAACDAFASGRAARGQINRGFQRGRQLNRPHHNNAFRGNVNRVPFRQQHLRQQPFRQQPLRRHF